MEMHDGCQFLRIGENLFKVAQLLGQLLQLMGDRLADVRKEGDGFPLLVGNVHFVYGAGYVVPGK